jgi:hypothetical protein
MFQTNAVEKLKTHILYSVIFFQTSCCLWIMWKKYYKAGQATWKYGACALHAGYLRLQIHTIGCVTIIAFPLQQWLHNAPQCYVTRTLPVLLFSLLTAITNIGKSYINKTVSRIEKKDSVCQTNWILIYSHMDVGPCHHDMARPQVADVRTAFNMEGSCECIE